MKKFFITFTAILTTVTLLCGCSTLKHNEWVLSVNGEKITKAEYMVYLYEQVKAFEQTGGADIWGADFDGVSAQEVAKQNAANSLLRAKLAVKEASSLGIDSTLNSEDSAYVDEHAQELYENISKNDSSLVLQNNSDISLDLCKSIVTDGVIQGKVYNAVTDGYEISDEDFDAYYSQYYNNNIDLYKTISLKSIFVAKDPNNKPQENVSVIDEYSNTIKKEISAVGKEKIDEAYNLLKQGEAFGRVQYDYSEMPDRREYSMSADLYNEEITNAIYDLKQGEYTNVLEYEDGYYIFYANAVNETDTSLMRNEIYAAYQAEKREEVYQSQNNKWQSAAEIKRNSDVWESIVINNDANNVQN